MHAVTEMADLTKFCQTEWLFMDLTILTNCSQIRQSEITSADLTILTNFSPFLLLHAFLDFFRKLKWTGAVSVINPKLF